MDWSNIESGWKEYQVNAKNRWNKLTNELLEATHGKRENLAAKVQETYGLTAEATEQQIADWQSRQEVKQAPAAGPAK
jgi:uncharacterized protein YjbJ (UPF0337 family)